MKVNIQKLVKRFIPLLSVFVILLGSFAVPAFAEEINYRDYETSVKVDGDYDLVTVTFPTEWIKGYVGHEGGRRIVSWSGPHFQWSAYDHDYDRPTDTFQIYIAPFGTIQGAYNREYNGRYLSLDNIPSDSVFRIGFSFYGSANITSYVWESVRDRFYSVTDGYASMYINQIRDLSHYGGLSYASTVQISPGTGEGWFPEYIFIVSDPSEDPDLSYADWTFSVDYFTLEMSISSLYRLQEQSGITNDLLTEVNKQLAEQGKTMEDILNGTPEMNNKVDSAVDGMQSAGEDLKDLGESLNAVEKPNTENLDVGINSFIPETSFLAFTAPIRTLWENDTLVSMLVIVLTLVLVSWVFFGKKG